MIILLYGEDSYRARQKLNEIIAEYKKVHKSGLNLRYFDCQDPYTSALDLKDEARQSSMFKDKRLFVATNVFCSARTKDDFLKITDSLAASDDLTLIYEESNIAKNDSLLKTLEKKAKCQEFKNLTPVNLKNWAKNEFNASLAKIDAQALDVFVNYIGNDLWRMANEVKKLASFKKGEIIKTEDVAFLTEPKLETDIFKTIDAIAQKDKKNALKLIQKHLGRGDSPLYLLSMISYQFRNLLIIKDLIDRKNNFSAIAKKSGFHPFVLRKSYFLAQKFTLEELKKIYQDIFQADLDIKTGKIEQDIALELLVAGI